MKINEVKYIWTIMDDMGNIFDGDTWVEQVEGQKPPELLQWLEAFPDDIPVRLKVEVCPSSNY